jgi:hypothetical protein
MARRQAHVHKYKRTNIGRVKEYLVYKCELPGCTHYTPVEMVIGKTTKCCICDKPYEIKAADIQYVRIACDACKGKRVKNPLMREKIIQNRQVAKAIKEEPVDMMELLLSAADIDFKDVQ